MDVIKELNLNVYRYNMIPIRDFIYVSDLRAAIEKLPRVYGRQTIDHGDWEHVHLGKHTHTALLIGVEKLVKEPVRVEKNFLKENPDNYFKSIEVPKEFNGKPFKVVFEEVIE